LEWEERERPHRIEEAIANTVAILVDTMGTGALRVYKEDDKKEEYEYLGGVGVENDTVTVVFIPWNSQWRLFCSGTLKTRFIVSKAE
jgi:hypothetical protein